MECIPTISSTGSSSKTRNKNNEKKCMKKSKGVKLSTDPQSVAARERRHRISDRFKILQSMVPGGNKMDTVSMLEEAIHYVKFLKAQIWLHQTMINFVDNNQDSPMFLPSECYCSLLENPSGSVESLQSLPQLPLNQFSFQGEEDTNTISNATMKYWPA